MCMSGTEQTAMIERTSLARLSDVGRCVHVFSARPVSLGRQLTVGFLEHAAEQGVQGAMAGADSSLQDNAALKHHKFKGHEGADGAP